MERKIELFIDAMTEQYGLHPHFSYPFSFRLLSRIGLSMRPPIFRSFAENALTWGVPLALIWAVLVYLWETLQGKEIHALIILFFSILAGTLYGLSQAIRYARKAKSLQLSAWDEYDPQK